MKTDATRTMMTGDFVRLRHTFRFSAIPTLYRENVAEHGYWTAMIGMCIVADLVESGVEISDDLMGEVAMKGLLHDIEESLTGDVVRDLKYATPEIREAIGRVEAQFVDRLMNPMGPQGQIFKMIWGTAKEPATDSGLIVALADLFCVISYCEHEFDLGNHNLTLTRILDDCLELIRTKFVGTFLEGFVNEWLRRRRGTRA